MKSSFITTTRPVWTEKPLEQVITAPARITVPYARNAPAWTKQGDKTVDDLLQHHFKRVF
jgi:hypothetical protein